MGVVYGLGVVSEVKLAGGRVRYRARVPDGAGKHTEAGRYDTEEGAWSALKGLAEKRAAGELAVGGMTLRAWGVLFLNRREMNGTRNIDTDRGRWTLHIESSPFIDWQLDTIRHVNVAEWIDHLCRKLVQQRGKKKRGKRTLSPQTIRHCVALLRRALRLALLRGLVTINAAAGHELPPVGEDGWTYLLLEEQARLFNAEGIPVSDRLCAEFAVGSGLREGEQWTLHLADVHAGEDEEHPHVIVRFGGRKKGRFMPPKNGKIRRVELFGHALAAARAQIQLLPTWCKANPLGLLWPTQRGHLRQDKAPRGWSTATRKNAKSHLEAAGLHRPEARHDGRAVRWHDNRHTCATALISGLWGRVWTLQEVMIQLGHRDLKTTLRYAHMAPGVLGEAARKTGSGGAGKPGGRANLPATRPRAEVGRSQPAEMIGTPEGTRTPDQRLRRPPLYPTELRARALPNHSKLLGDLRPLGPPPRARYPTVTTPSPRPSCRARPPGARSRAGRRSCRIRQGSCTIRLTPRRACP
jgi:integrase